MVPSCVIIACVIIMTRVKIMGSYGILCQFCYDGTCYYNGKCNFVMVKLSTGGGTEKEPKVSVWLKNYSGMIEFLK